MTVRQLIELLSTFPPDADVLMLQESSHYLLEVDRVQYNRSCDHVALYPSET